VCLSAQLLHQLDIFPVAMIVIAGYQAAVAIQNSARRSTEAIPDRLSSPVFKSRSLHLVCIGPNTPAESFRKSNHSYLAILASRFALVGPQTCHTASCSLQDYQKP